VRRPSIRLWDVYSFLGRIFVCETSVYSTLMSVYLSSGRIFVCGTFVFGTFVLERVWEVRRSTIV